MDFPFDANPAARRLVDERVRYIDHRLMRPLPAHPPPATTPERRRAYLVEEAQELYWNEVRWEQETEEELTEDGELTEMVFPGFLALVDALVVPHLHDGKEDSHRDVVHDLLQWLADRLLRLRAERPDPQARVQEVILADRVIDLVLYRYLLLRPEEVELVDAGRG